MKRMIVLKPSRNVFSVFATLALSVLIFAGARADEVYQFPEPDETLLRLLSQEDIANPNSYWMQFGVGGTVFDERAQTWSPRWSPSIEAGKRFGRFGVFLNLALDQTLDLTEEVKTLNVLHIGVGIEHLAFLGHLRSSISAGSAILETDTDIDDRGELGGWYTDFRPVSVRFGPYFGGVFEITPFGVNVSVPVPKGIPLILFAYFTTVSFEWSFGQ